MCYLYVVAFLFSSVMGDVSMLWATMGGGLLAQQAPANFADTSVTGKASQQSTETGSGFPEFDVSGSRDRNGKAEGIAGNLDKPKDLQAFRQELKRAVDSGAMTEEAALQAWDDMKAKAQTAGSDKDEDAPGRDWIGDHLALFLTAVYGGCFVLMISIFVIYFVYVARREKARTAALENATAELGLRFEPAGDESLTVDLAALPIFNRGRRKKITNLIVADTPDLQVHVFDYLFITGYGKSQTNHRTTVVSLRSDTLVLPSLQVRPRNAFADGIKSMFGAGGIAMDQYPAFAKNYVVQSDQPQQACDFLDAEMVAVCEENQGCSLECQAGVVLHFRAGKRVEPNTESIRGFMGEGFQFFQHVEDRLQRKT